MPTVTTDTPTARWNNQATPDFAPKPMDAAALAAYGALFAQTPVTYMDNVNAGLGTPTTQAEAADAVVRVRLSGAQAGITPTQAMTEADMASRAMYASTSLLQVTHPDALNVATRVAVLRGDASPVQEPSPLEIDLKSILGALEQRDAAPTAKRSTLKGAGPS